jgi:hypothetical protein
MSNLDALFLLSGDSSEDDAPRKTSAVQVNNAIPVVCKLYVY